MRKRITDKNYKYGFVLEEESQIFFRDIYERINLKKIFKDKKILDLGCGIGAEPFALSQFTKQVIGVDIEQHNEWKEFKDKKIQFAKATSSKIPFNESFFDGVYLKDLLHHINHYEKTLDEIKRVTKNNGDIVIVEANRYNPLFYIYVTRMRGHDHFTQSEFKKIINAKFSNTKFLYLEALPPFVLRANIYSRLLRIQKQINKLMFLKPIFTYNIAIIKNVK